MTLIKALSLVVLCSSKKKLRKPFWCCLGGFCAEETGTAAFSLIIRHQDYNKRVFAGSGTTMTYLACNKITTEERKKTAATCCTERKPRVIRWLNKD